MHVKVIHKVPSGWTVRGFDKWACGATAYSHETGTQDKTEVTCSKCKESNMRVAFDVKGTLVGFNSAKVWHLFNILRQQGHEMFIWSNSFSYALDTLDAMGKEANGIVALTKYAEYEINNEDCHVMDLAVEDDTSQTWLAAKKFVFVHEIPEELEKIKEFASNLFSQKT